MTPPERNPEKPSAVRIAIWVFVGAVAIYFIGSGVVGLVSGGN